MPPDPPPIPPIPKPVLPHTDNFITDDRALLFIGAQLLALFFAAIVAISRIRFPALPAAVTDTIVYLALSWFFGSFLVSLAKYLVLLTSLTAIATVGLMPPHRHRPALCLLIASAHAAFLLWHLLWLRHHLGF